MTEHAPIVKKAAAAVAAYRAWEARTQPTLRRIARVSKRAGPRESYARHKALAERREYLAKNPAPKTADEILTEYAGDDVRLWQRLSDAVLDRVRDELEIGPRDRGRPRKGTTRYGPKKFAKRRIGPAHNRARPA